MQALKLLNPCHFAGAETKKILFLKIGMDFTPAQVFILRDALIRHTDFFTLQVKRPD